MRLGKCPGAFCISGEKENIMAKHKFMVKGVSGGKKHKKGGRKRGGKKGHRKGHRK
jgi:hypothetical protein